MCVDIVLCVFGASTTGVVLFSSVGVFLSALCPHVAYSINTLCDFGALCSTDEAVNPQPVRLDLPSIEAAKQRCCVEEQAAFYFYSGVGCNPCKSAIR